MTEPSISIEEALDQFEPEFEPDAGDWEEILSRAAMAGTEPPVRSKGRLTRRRVLLVALVAAIAATLIATPAFGIRGLFFGSSAHLAPPQHVYLLEVRGGRVTSGDRTAWAPAWSPDGKRIALVEEGHVIVLSRDGRLLSRVPVRQSASPDPPSWSPDRRRLAFTALSTPEGPAHIVVAPADGSPPTIVATTRWGTADSQCGPVWSPDGRLLAFCLRGPETTDSGGLRVSGDLDLALVSPGTAPKRLTSMPGNEFDPVWSPDGRRLLYSWDSGAGGATALRLVPRNGGRSRLVFRLASVWGAAWSPHGTLIAFVGSRPDESKAHLYVVRPDGTGLERLTGEVTPDRPAWSPSGSAIAFATYDGRIETIRPDGLDRRIVASLGHADIGHLAWSPDGRTIAFDARLTPPSD